MKTYIGIDPGKAGYVCVRDEIGYYHIPLSEKQGTKGINPEVLDALKDVAGKECMAVVESVHAMPAQGLSSTFTFGKNFGMVLGMLMALDIPYVLVPPQRWQKEMVTSADWSERTKDSSYNAAHRLHPKMDFRRSDRAYKWDDNKVDATLICDYGIRKNL